MKPSPSIARPIHKLIKQLEQIQITTPESPLYGEAALRLTEVHDRNIALIAALREARDFIEAMLDANSTEALDLFSGNVEDVTARLNGALHLDAFDIGDNVLAESADLNLSEYVGTIVRKRANPDGSVLFTVEDQDGDSWDHEPHELRRAD